MEKRILREVEKNRSVLAKSRPEPLPDYGGFNDSGATTSYKTTTAQVESQTFNPEKELTPQQIQIFEKENQDMLKHYESTLDQVRFVDFGCVW